MSDELRPAFNRLVYELRGYLPNIVVAGGWAPYLYHRYLFSQEGNEPIKTEDIDIVVPERLQISGGKTIDAVLSALGFKPIPSSPDSPLMTAYEGEIDGIELQLEFLTHLRGSREDIAVLVQSGLSAQALRYTSILHENQTAVTINDFLIDGALVDLRVNVPTPAAFVYNKGLVFPRRNSVHKRAKDLYYIFDILSFDYSNSRIDVASEVTALASSYPDNWLKTLKGNLSKYFSSSHQGTDLVLSQKPIWAYTEMNDEQFKVFVGSIFNEFIKSLSKS
ncbi:MAG TPA: GSU2403 family nucleotidyltransferase fold protein [Anaerolineae bacterium]|nr:GSU2403 family nucleotidyltransferase fold protein [Anaerolineae bacterium]